MFVARLRAIVPTACAATAFAFFGSVYSPTVLYSTNREQFFFPLVQILPVLLLVAAGVAIALTLPALVMPRRVRRFYAALIATLTVFAWLHGFVLVQDYGLLDGDVDLPAFSVVPVILSAATIVAISIGVTMARVPRAAIATAVALALVLPAAHAGAMISDDTNPTRPLGPSRLDELYELGSDNIVVVLLDSLQSDIFAEVVEEHPEFREALDGFTYYRNTMGVAPTTFGSLPAIHSGRSHQPGTSMGEFYADAIGEESFMTTLARDGVSATYLNPLQATCPRRVTCYHADEVRSTPTRKRMLGQAAELLDLAMFRLAPPELKASVYNDTRWRIQKAFQPPSDEEGSDATLRTFTTNVRRGAERERTIKFIHIFSTHAPVTRRADCTLLETPEDMTRSGARDISTCALTRVAEFIAKLKRLRAYDDTSIVLLADHGYRDMANRRVDDEEWTRIIGRANPLLAVKQAGDSGPMRVHDAELSLVDVKTIVCSLADGCGDEAADYEAVDDDRARPFMLYVWSSKFWLASTLKGERRFEVQGPLVDPASWRELEGREMPTVDRLAFDGTDSADHFGYGWAPRDDTDESRWTFGEVASLFMRLPTEGDIRLTFDVARLAEHTEQSVTFKVNGEEMGTFDVDGEDQMIDLVVPSEIARKNRVDEIVMRFAQHRPDRRKHDTGALAVRFDDLGVTTSSSG
jgi:hypothetical protein